MNQITIYKLSILPLKKYYWWLIEYVKAKKIILRPICSLYKILNDHNQIKIFVLLKSS